MTKNEKSVEACIELLEKLKGIDPEDLAELTFRSGGPEASISFRDSFTKMR